MNTFSVPVAFDVWKIEKRNPVQFQRHILLRNCENQFSFSDIGCWGKQLHSFMAFDVGDNANTCTGSLHLMLEIMRTHALSHCI